MVGKARTFSDSEREGVHQKEADNELYALGGQQNPLNLGSTQFSDQSGIGNFSQGGSANGTARLIQRGFVFTGHIGFVPQTVQLNVTTETINLFKDGSGNSVFPVSTDKTIVLSTGTTANLTTILGAQKPGQRLRLYNKSGDTVTIKNTTAATIDTILTPDGNDLVLELNACVDLTYDTGNSKWRVVGNIGAGGTGNVPDGTAQFQHLEWSGSAWIAQQSLDFGANSGATAELNFPNNVIGLSWRNAANDGDIELKTNTAGTLDLTRNDETVTSFQIRSQHPTQPDQTASFSMGSGTDADFIFNSPNDMLLSIGGTTEYEFTSTAFSLTGNTITNSGAILPITAGTTDLGSDLLYWDQLNTQSIELLGSLSSPTASTGTRISRNSAGDMEFNVEATTDIYEFYADGNSLGSIRRSGTNGIIDFDVVEANAQFVLQNSGVDPAITGIFTTNGADVKVYSGGSVRNLSDIASGATFNDNVFTIQNNTDNTKKVMFDVSAVTTATTRTLTIPDDNGAILTPNVSATLTNKTFLDSTCVFADQADNTKQLRFEANGLTTATIRTWTAQDADITVAGLNAVQTFTAAQSFDDIAKLAMNSDITFPTANLDIGNSLNYPDTLYCERINFPAVTGVGVSSEAILRRATVSSVNSVQLNVPTSEDFIVTENGVTSPIAFQLDMSTGDMILDAPLLSLVINPSDSLTLAKGENLNGELTSNRGFDLNIAPGNTIDHQINSVSVLEITGSDINVNQDLDMDVNATVDFNTTSNAATAGSAILPSNPAGFIIIKVNGVERKVPFYLN